ncbi:TPA_asm: hypothetical protein GZM43_17990, partial [Listeria monocytogenes]|nr:hypothetical protein [Listeria monocytogenes]
MRRHLPIFLQKCSASRTVQNILIFVGKSYNFINPKGITMTKQVFQTTFAGRELIVETGQVAKQANGAVVVRYGESTVLTAAVMSKKMATGDFFPLQ